MPPIAMRVPPMTTQSTNGFFLRPLVSWVRDESVVPMNTLKTRPGIIPSWPRAKFL